MIELFISNFEKIIGSILVAVFGGYVAYRTYQKTRFNTAADKFKSTVLTELKGIVPVEGFWNQDIYIRIKETIPNIQRAAIEFYPTITYFRKRRFNEAVIEYCEQSENINWIQAIADAADETSPKETQKGKFVKCVFHLLSFTE